MSDGQNNYVLPVYTLLVKNMKKKYDGLYHHMHVCYSILIKDILL